MDELKTKKQIKEEIAEAYEKLEERLIYEDYGDASFIRGYIEGLQYSKGVNRSIKEYEDYR